MALGLQMNLLLDTCALIALSNDSLTRLARKNPLRAPDAVISPIAVWKIAIKVKAGKLQLPCPPPEWAGALAERHSLAMRSGNVETAIFCHAADLPLIHRDPFDRVLIATAQLQNFTILTSDRIIPTYPGVRTTW
jgi:PIN domain nuclease of toxin-antitoxin system